MPDACAGGHFAFVRLSEDEEGQGLAGWVVGVWRGIGFDFFVTGVDFLELEVAQAFYIDHLVASRIDGADELIELEIDGAGVAVLGVLDEEDHQEGDDGGAGVDDELPGVGVVEDGAGERPGDDDQAGRDKGPLGAHEGGGLSGEAAEPVAGMRGGAGWRFRGEFLAQADVPVDASFRLQRGSALVRAGLV